MIRRLYVHNFRCLENFELPLGERSSVLLIGRNGAGKSTVGAVLEVLQRIARGTLRIRDILRLRDFPYGRADSPMRFEIEVCLEPGVFRYVLAVAAADQTELRVVEEELWLEGQALLSRNTAGTRMAPGSSGVINVDPAMAALPIIQMRASTDPIAIFRKWLSAALILRPVPQLFRGETNQADGDGGLLNSRAGNIGAWFSGMMTSTPAGYAVLQDYLKQVMPGFDGVTNELVGEEARRLSFRFGQGRARGDLTLDQLSDGEKCFFLHGMVAAAAKVQESLLCFWDEPDNFLAPDEVGHAMLDLRRAFEGGGQLIVTSHDPEAMQRFPEEGRVVLARRSRLEPPTYRSVAALRAAGDFEGSFVDALLVGDIGADA